MIKVATIFGIAGACRREELTKLTLDDIEDKENLLILKIPDSKNHSSRKFVVSSEDNNGAYLSLYRKYANLRKPATPHRRFFVYYKFGKCTIQCVGINTFGKMPSEIAAYLGLANPELYTGHSFRRSSATILADSGEGITNIKRHGGWKSTAVAEGYLEDSLENKKAISKKILPHTSISQASGASTSNLHPTTSSASLNSGANDVVDSVSELTTNGKNSEEDSDGQYHQVLNRQSASAINLQNPTNCTFTINIVNNK